MNISPNYLFFLLIVLVIYDMTDGLRRVRHKSRENCQLIPDSGSCTATLRRWYYDSETDECKTFIWGGCDGNDNRFRSRRQCERRCKDRGLKSDDDRMSTYFRAVSRSGRGCPRLRCGDHGSSCPPGTSPVFSTDDAGCPICKCRQLTAFLRPSTTCPPLDCSHLICVGPVRFSSRLVGHCPVCECVPVDDEAAESAGTTASCPDLDCRDSFPCRANRKRDPQTGCETCECIDDDCSDCAAVCASSEPTRCASLCECDGINTRACRPVPTDCQLRDGCVLGIDADGCQVCQCAVAETSTTPPFEPVCPRITCSLTCDKIGYAVDENGCRVCACASEEAETTTIATTSTACSTVDCVSLCPQEFDVVKDDGCDTCVCRAPADVKDDVTEPPCSSSTDCEPSSGTSRQNDVTGDLTAAKCEPVMRDNCDDNCVVAKDDAGCQFCLCDDRVLDQSTETVVRDNPTTTTDVKITAAVAMDGDDATTKIVEELCEHQLVCHPICQTVWDNRGCVVECRCDDVVSSLEEMQQQQQQQRLEFAADSEPGVIMCPTEDNVCSCDVDDEELWTVNVDGCLTCVCVTPSTTTSDISQSSRMEYRTLVSTTTAQPRTSNTTTQVTTSTISMTTTMTTSQQQVTSTASIIATSANVTVECRQLSDGDCADVTCGDAGYAKDDNGCDTCSCAIVREDKQPAKPVYHVVAAARKGACSLSPLRGPCRALLTRWYYDVTSDTCETFSYGGCRGNANNFRSMESCWRYCRPVVDKKQHESRMWYLRVLGLLR